MDINVLKTFVAVCEYAGFSAAGEKLGLTQSTVSSQIKQFEKELGVTLFDRIRHKTLITDEGRVVLRYAREMLALQQMMTTELDHKGALAGEVRLAMANSVCSKYFTDDYLEFHRKYPDIRVNIVESGTEHMFDMLRKNEVDIVFTLDNHIYDPEFAICAEKKEATHFVASSDHPLAKAAAPLSLKDVAGEAFILTEGPMSYRKLLNHRLAEESLSITPLLELGNTEQICRLLTKSRALSFLPDFITEPFIASGELVRLPVADCDVTVWTQILIHKNKWKSPAMEAFIGHYVNILP